jgi:AcrR family transcriptional regulator
MARDEELPVYIRPEDSPSKRAILKAALELFVTEGVAGSTVRAIGERAGYSNPVVYKGFDSKDAVALELFERCHQALYRVGAQAMEGEAQPLERLTRYVEGYAHILETQPEVVLFVDAQLERLWPLVVHKLRGRSLIGRTKDLIRQIPRERPLSAGEESVLVAAIIGFLCQLARQHRVGELEGGPSARVPQITRLIVQLLRA